MNGIALIAGDDPCDGVAARDCGGVQHLLFPVLSVPAAPDGKLAAAESSGGDGRWTPIRDQQPDSSSSSSSYIDDS